MAQVDLHSIKNAASSLKTLAACLITSYRSGKNGNLLMYNCLGVLAAAAGCYGNGGTGIGCRFSLVLVLALVGFPGHGAVLNDSKSYIAAVTAGCFDLKF
jgi:hypothetical protein